MKAKTISPAVAASPRDHISQLRGAIAQAESDGLDKNDMVLRMTWRDETYLKRDQSIGLDEVSFSDGQMRFLGVKVVTGGVGSSELDRGAA